MSIASSATGNLKAADGGNDPRPLSQRLKEDNWDLHHQAEHDRLPQHMVGGTIPKETYVEVLGQMYLANAALDAAVLEHRDTTPILKNLVSDRQLQKQYLEADLAHYGVDPASIEPKAGTAALVGRVEDLRAAGDGLGLFGLHYVREGANNGNRFVAMKIKKAWGIEADETAGFRYLDPYGKDQRPLWDDFKTRLDEQDLTEEEKGRVVASARTMFEMIMSTHRDYDLPEPPPARQGGEGHA